MEIPAISSVPRTVEDIFKGFSAGHSAIVHALTSTNSTSSAIQIFNINWFQKQNGNDEGISYAKLANLPPVIGLYSSFVPPLIYSVLGSSGDLAVGPISIASLVMGSMLREVISPEKEPILYIQLTFTATFFAGVFQASLGLLS